MIHSITMGILAYLIHF